MVFFAIKEFFITRFATPANESFVEYKTRVRFLNFNTTPC